MRDYDGPMEFFENQLTRAGVTKDEFDISNWVGCTKVELQALVDNAIYEHKREEKKK